MATPKVFIDGVAKGVTRKPGLETLYLNDAAHEFTLPGDSPALHLIQQVRDEAHRFAQHYHHLLRHKRFSADKPKRPLKARKSKGENTLSEDGKHNLQRAMHSAKNMSQLIADLIFEISGTRRWISSNPALYASE